MAVLVIAEHDNAALKAATLNTLAAALEIDTEVEALGTAQQAVQRVLRFGRIDVRAELLLKELGRHTL